MTLLDQLKKMTVVVADTGDINSIKKFKPRDATTNPSLITAAAQMPEYATSSTTRCAGPKQRRAAPTTKVDRARARSARVEFGLRILKIVPGPRLDRGRRAALATTRRRRSRRRRYLIEQYEAAGATRERVLIKIASTWEGIRAAEMLEKEGIHCNLTLLFGMHQAIACAEAGVTLISPFVGRILDWYKKDDGPRQLRAGRGSGRASR